MRFFRRIENRTYVWFYGSGTGIFMILALPGLAAGIFSTAGHYISGLVKKWDEDYSPHHSYFVEFNVCEDSV